MPLPAMARSLIVRFSAEASGDASGGVAWLAMRALFGRTSRAVPGFAVRLRAFVRGRELGLIVLGIAVGAVSGVMVTGMSRGTQYLHEILFGFGGGTRLSALTQIAWPGALMPAAGGLLMGLIALALARRGKRAMVDPIEANALHGGRMSMTDSIIIAVQTIVSNGFGASVGLEAGYTQISSGVASKLGVTFRMRRNDLRVLVGCGAAAAIAAAFNAPLTGAFYSFELIVGTYTVATVAPVMAAALTGVLVSRALGGAAYDISVATAFQVGPADYAIFIVLALICAGLGIFTMRAMSAVEHALDRTGLPAWLRPVGGGLVVGACGLVSPQVLSSGHGALHVNLINAMPMGLLAGLFVLKLAASAISLGSGFRGGLFFASLFLGALLGKFFAAVLALAGPLLAVDPVAAAVVGMGAFAVAVIGGPLTMAFLALETTGDFSLTGVVLAAAVVASLTVRATFGYSFSTWRLHLRGESIRSAQDVGWLRSLSVGRMMRHDVRTVPADATIEQFRRKFPLGSTQRVVAIGPEDRYEGMILVPEAHADAWDADAASRPISELLHCRDTLLRPALNVKQAVALFERSESEALAVVDDERNRRVIGLLTEAHAMRRYAEELEKARRGLAGER